MLLTTSSAGAIIHSALLTKFAVTGHYQVRPGVSKKNISTQQSKWMEMLLEDGGGAAALALGGGIGHRLKIAAVALDSGGGRRTCNNGIGIDVGVDIVKAEGLLLQRWHQRW
jgi:hypothetical protein